MSSIFYRESGEGFPLVFLHGYCESHTLWEHFSAELSSGFRVIRPDLPGFGQSGLLPTPFVLADVAIRLADWLASVGVERCVLIGHSLGGYIALEMARHRPGLLAGFGLFNSSAFGDSPEKKENRNKLIDFIAREGVEPFIRTFVPSLFYPARAEEHRQIIERQRQEGNMTAAQTVMAYAAAMRDRPDGMDVLRKYAAVTLLIAGEHDQNVPLEKSRAMAAFLPPGRAHILPGTAHMAMFEQPYSSLEAVLNFAAEIRDTELRRG
jgi:pimeloyl-ACP methyl ester carboxylesterase